MRISSDIIKKDLKVLVESNLTSIGQSKLTGKLKSEEWGRASANHEIKARCGCIMSVQESEEL